MTGKGFETAIGAVRPKVLALARRFVRAARLEEDPEDITQDVLLRLWDALRSGIDIRNAEAWAVAATKNGCVSLMRRKRSGKCGQVPESLADENDASLGVEATEAERIVRQAWARIPAGTRRLLQLRAQGLTLDEIAAVTGRPKGSVKSSISTARKEMMKTLSMK